MDKSKLNRFFLNESTDSERKAVISWLLDSENDLLIKKWMQENWYLISSLDLQNHPDNPDENKIWLTIQEKIWENSQLKQSSQTDNVPILFLSYRLRKIAAVAAMLVVFLSCLTYLLLYKISHVSNLAQSKKPFPVLINDVAPPKVNNAILTLADGRKIYLDSAGNGILATQSGVNILKNTNDEIIYSGLASDSVTFNTLSVPRGSKPVRLVLSDKSLVWLNSASSITFPTVFIGSDRKINITGEVYFEITKNPNMPFFVSKNDVTIKVLGTHFNVNAYDDEKGVKVTLLEGKVNVSRGEIDEILQPGQQATVLSGNIKVLSNVDLDEVMAWKNEQFYFSGTDIKSIMRQIEKYYNVEVEYKDNIPYQFVAKIPRQVNVSQFLKRLELTNLIHFQITGNKIIVTK